MAIFAQKKLMPDWHTLLDGLQASPMEFYASVEAAIKKRQVPKASTSLVEWHEGGAFAGRRLYLRVIREGDCVDICGAPFGTGFFISSRLRQLRIELTAAQLLSVLVALLIVYLIASGYVGVSLAILPVLIILAAGYAVLNMVATRASEELNAQILRIPMLGVIYEVLFHPVSYYRIDTALMFRESVHRSVMEVVDELTKAGGIRALSELERKPILKEFF